MYKIKLYSTKGKKEETTRKTDKRNCFSLKMTIFSERRKKADKAIRIAPTSVEIQKLFLFKLAIFLTFVNSG
jgi:hypothetical protein